MNPNQQRSFLNKFDTTKQPSFGPNYQTSNPSHPNPYSNPELIMRHNAAGMSDYSHGIPYDSSGSFYSQTASETKYPMNAFSSQLDNKVRNEDYQFAFNTKLPQPPIEPVKRFGESGVQMNQPNLGAQSFKQKLLEKYGKNPEAKRQPFEAINDSGGFSQEPTASAFPASKLANFSADHSNESMYPGPDKSWLKNDQSVDANATKILADDSKDNKPPVNPNEEIMGAIIKNQINCVSLLNEIGSKVKKRVDYTIKEIPMAKIKVFECTCVFEKQNIGFGKGNSKQAAKTDAAIEGVRTLLTKDEYTYEKAHITLSVQKLTGVGTQASTTSIQASVLAPDAVQDNVAKARNLPEGGEADHSQLGKSQAQAEAEALMNDSALYELNLIAKECFIEPRWIMSPPGGPNGDFEAQVIFDKLVATGKGRKKLDAKREAALKIIQQIRSNKELSDKYNPKSKKKSSRDDGIPEIAKNDQAKLFFESCIDPRSLQVFESNSAVWKDDLTKLDTNFDNYLSKIMEKQEIDEDNMDMLHDFFKQVADLTSMATSNPKQILLDAPKHLADYTVEASLVPVGSFALDCMRKDNLSLDALLVFQETKRIAEKELLDLYRCSLEEGQKINLQQNPQLNKMQFSLETSDIGDYILVTVNSKNGRLALQIQVANLTNDAAKKYESTIMHVKRIYDCLEESDKLSRFRNLMTLIRIWRTRNNLVLLPTELLDAILLNEFLNNKTGNNAGYLMNCLITMSTEETFQAALNKCGSFYARLYKDMPSKFKWTISSKCSQSLEAICKEAFDESRFY